MSELEARRLAAISTIAMSNTPDSFAKNNLAQDHELWTAAFGDVAAAVRREMEQRQRAELLEYARTNPRYMGSKSAASVVLERHRQQASEGWTEAHDDEHKQCEMGRAAQCYIGGYSAIWPWNLDWWKPTTYRRNLVKAGALILAEIDRIDRLEEADRRIAL